MKKQWTIYIALLSLMFVNISCLGDDDEEVLVSPYVSLRSFSIGNLKAYSAGQTTAGKDTVTSSLVVSSLYSFIIDQKNCTVYNPDSLPLGTDVTGVLANVESDGVAYVYVDSLEAYIYHQATDSIDFTTPRRFLIASLDGLYAQEYTVQLNVHKVDPDMMSWESMPVSEIVHPMRVIEKSGCVHLFGKNDEGSLFLSTMAPDGLGEWSSPVAITTLPATAKLQSVQLFNDNFYAVADGALYSSADGVLWNKTASENSFEALFAASDIHLWAVADGSLACSTDGVNFEHTEPLPSDFPLYNTSVAIYPLQTNPHILRYTLVGYSDEQCATSPAVWSILSTEKKWAKYSSISSKKEYQCPAFKNLTVLHYNERLYAFGGAASDNGTMIEPFEAFYTSYDNGLTWRRQNDNKIVLPTQLKGVEADYVATVDSKNNVWIIVGGDDKAVWRGAINRLKFE